MGDLISRQAAIDAIEIEKSLCERPITETRWFDFGLGKAQEVLSKLHPAQPEQKTPPKHGTGGMTMADYISRKAVFDWFCESADIDGCVDLPKNNGSCKKGSRHCIAGKELDEIPAADVVEKFIDELTKEISDRVIRALEANYEIIPKKPVVRCKDCKWFNDSGCAIRIVDESDKPREDDYCSFAERKENG